MGIGKNSKLKVFACIVAVLSLLVSMLVCNSGVFFAANVNVHSVSDLTYYFWGQNNNGPDFSSMSKPTGTMTYDSAKGYYYYDIETFTGGDYCFVISTNGTGGSSAVNNQALTSVGASGEYYLQHSNYSSYKCYHIWNSSKVPVRIYFSSVTTGCYAVPVSSENSQTQPSTTSTQPHETAATQISTVTDPTSATTSDSNYVYCENAAGWSTVYAYMWTDKNNNSAWPGKPMTYIGDNIWQYEVTGEYKYIIFNNANSSQTGDIAYPGDGNMYNNSTNTWGVYDTLPLRVKSFTADLVSPQYKDTDIVLSAYAVGEGDVYYRFTAINNITEKQEVLSDYSLESKTVWSPSEFGEYTLLFEYKDTSGNTNQRKIKYEILDDSDVTDPIIKSVTPGEGQILVNSENTVYVNASGGHTGTNLLFYKYTLADHTGKTVNVPYYSTSSKYSFVPTNIGTYTLTVSVQASNNKEVSRTYSFDSVDKISEKDELKVFYLKTSGSLKAGNTIKVEAQAQGGELPYTYQFLVNSNIVQNYSSSNEYEMYLPQEGKYIIGVNVTDNTGKTAHREIEVTVTKSGDAETQTVRGDADKDGKLSIIDATWIQRFCASLIEDSEINLANADADLDGKVTIIDATVIQRRLANIITQW